MMVMAGEQTTGIRDDVYDLISVLYHVLQGASTCEQYLRDADQQGDRELLEFFRDYQEEQKHLAERARNLLGARLARRGMQVQGEREGGSVRKYHPGDSPGAQLNAQVQSGGQGHEDIVDEESMESFPASDSPSHY